MEQPKRFSRKKKILIAVIVVLLLAGGGSAWYVLYGGNGTSGDKQSDNNSAASTQTPTKDIITIVEANNALSNFSKLLTASGVKFTLQTVGTNYLVLAPNNDGFKNLPTGYYDGLLTTDKQVIAQNISKYQVIVQPTAALAAGQKLKTLEGQEVIVGIQNGKFTFTDAKANVATAVGAAQKATNGTIYIVNTLLLPQ